MPTLKNLIEELGRLSPNPDEFGIPGELYDDVIEQIQDIADVKNKMNLEMIILFRWTLSIFRLLRI